MSDSTVAFLERLHNRTTKGIEEEIGKRVTFSKSIISQLVQFIDKRVTRGKDFGKMLNELKNTSEKSSDKEKAESSSDKTSIKEEEIIDSQKKEIENQKNQADEGIKIALISVFFLLNSRKPSLSYVIFSFSLCLEEQLFRLDDPYNKIKLFFLRKEYSTNEMICYLT